jgi:hypothetical protein
MYEKHFSNWISLKNLKDGIDLQAPGVYVVACSAQNIEGKKFRWRRNIIYIGMTNAATGLFGRLNGFNTTIETEGNRILHSGADRVLAGYRNHKILYKKLYISVRSFKCDVRRAFGQKNPCYIELKKMGKIPHFEYLCFSEYVRKYGHLPKFNGKKNIKRHSKKKYKVS